ncbi:MAG: carboxypeptidase-like regulatory domain-containing protein, partial [Planctomycetes bacterium]|nr:carboxypeptidase-like regulatory domain-containing protein [Planctomycetota bacterium]
MSSTMKAAIASVVVFSVIVVAALIAINSEDQSPPAPPPAGEDVVQAPEVPVDTDDELKTGVVPRKELITTADSVTVTFKISEKGSGTALRRALLTVAPLSEGSRSGPKAYSRAGATHTVDLRPGAWVVRVRCQSFSGERREITVQRDMPATYTFELARGDSITGGIVVGGGKGVGGARVLGLQSLHDPDADVEQSLLNLLKLEEQTNTIDSEDVTDADGSYELSGLQRGVRYKIRAIASGFAPGELRKATQAPKRNVDLTLIAGTRLSGVVVDTSGNPVAGATIDAYPEPKNQALFEIIASKSRPPVDSVTSDGRGAFEFTTLGRGTYNFLAHASGYQQMERFDVEVGRTSELRLELELGSAITGVVMSPDDLPIEGARIRFQRVGGTAAARPRQVNIRFGKDVVLSDVEGQFTIDTLADGDYSLIVFHDDYETVRRRGLRSGAEDVTLQMGLGGRITGVVTDNSG